MCLTLPLIQSASDIRVTHKWSPQASAVSISNARALPHLHLRERRFISSCHLSFRDPPDFYSFFTVSEEHLTLLLNSAIRFVPIACHLSNTAFHFNCVSTAGIWEAEVCQEERQERGGGIQLTASAGDPQGAGEKAQPGDLTDGTMRGRRGGCHCAQPLSAQVQWSITEELQKEGFMY